MAEQTYRESWETYVDQVIEETQEQDDAGEETFVAETQVDNANHETERRLSRHYHYDERRRTRRASSSYYAADHREKEMALLTEVLETLQTTKQEEQEQKEKKEDDIGQSSSLAASSNLPQETVSIQTWQDEVDDNTQDEEEQGVQEEEECTYVDDEEQDEGTNGVARRSSRTLADDGYTYEEDDDGHEEGGDTLQTSPLPSLQGREDGGGSGDNNLHEETQTTRTPSTVSSLGEAGAFHSPPLSSTAASPSLMSTDDDGIPTPLSVSLARVASSSTAVSSSNSTMVDHSPIATQSESGGDMMSMSSASPDLPYQHHTTRLPSRSALLSPSPTESETMKCRQEIMIPSLSPPAKGGAGAGARGGGGGLPPRPTSASSGPSSSSPMLCSDSSGSWHMARDIRRLSSLPGGNSPTTSATSPVPPIMVDDHHHHHTQAYTPPPPQASSSSHHHPCRRLWSPDHSGLAIITTDLHDLSLGGAGSQSHSKDDDDDVRRRESMLTPPTLAAAAAAVRTSSSSPSYARDDDGHEQENEEQRRLLMVPLQTEGDKLAKWMTEREEEGKGRRYKGKEPGASSLSSSRRALQALSSNSRRRDNGDDNDDDGEDDSCEKWRRRRRRGQERQPTPNPSTCGGVVVYLPPTEAERRRSLALLPSIIRYIIGRQGKKNTAGAAAPSPTSGNTLVVMTKNRLKAWEAALREGGGRGGGQQQQQQRLYMSYTAGQRERARMTISEICQHTFVLTTWDIFKAQEAMLGAEAEVGAWLGRAAGGGGGCGGNNASFVAPNKGCKLMTAHWQRIILDEAHKLSRVAGGASSLHPTLAKVKATSRWMLVDGRGAANRRKEAAAVEGEWGPKNDEKLIDLMEELWGRMDVNDDDDMATHHQAVNVFRLEIE